MVHCPVSFTVQSSLKLTNLTCLIWWLLVFAFGRDVDLLISVVVIKKSKFLILWFGFVYFIEFASFFSSRILWLYQIISYLLTKCP